MKCLLCNKETTNPKFCSRSCAATFSNKFSIAPKRKKTNKCVLCGTLIYSNLKYCKTCKPRVILNDLTLEEAEYTGSHLHRSSVYAKVRTRAKVVCKNWKKICAQCGYVKHVEVCHKKAINSFPKTTLISEINSPENLILLCPNCHWEYDHLK